MKVSFKSIAAVAVAGALSLGVLGSVAAPASAGVVAPKIIGGQKQPSNPWIYQLGAQTPQGLGGCTTEALDDHWILTAKHCVLKDPQRPSLGTLPATAFFVVRSNDTADFQNRSKQQKVDQVKAYSGGDIALLRVVSSNGLSSYPTIASSYTPKAGGLGLIEGYGLRKVGWEYCPESTAPSQQADWLYKANISVVGKSSDAYDGPAVRIKGVNGVANHGDSGGPLTLQGAPNQIVAITSNGDDNNCKNDIHAEVNYANVTLAAPRAWIKSVTGH